MNHNTGMMNRSPDIMFMAEYIKNVLYFATVRQGKTLKNTSDTHYFCIDNELVYENYYSDFGPLNLGCVYRYCRSLNEKITTYLNRQTIVHYTSIEPKKKANSAFLLGCYGVLYLSLTPRDALKPLLGHGQNYRPFQDATQGDSNFTISLLDCLQAIKKARDLGFFNFQDFNYEEYERLDKIQGGDLNWIVPGKFLAFIGPVDYSISLYHPPEMYLDYFIENNVKIVIRLNKRLYDANVFNNVGIVHYDLFFIDGSCPSRTILFKFLQISEEADCTIAVHCKAGLGRTGSLIGCYLIKHYKMTSHEAIGWMRICRPGSVIGHQQSHVYFYHQGWLEQLEPWLIKQGNIYRRHSCHDPDKLPYHEFGIYSLAERSKKQRPVLFQKPPSPPPPLQKLNTRPSDIGSHVRPQNSRIKEDKSFIEEEETEEEQETYIASCDLTKQCPGSTKQFKGLVLNNCHEEDTEIISKAAEKERDWRMKWKTLSSNQKLSFRGPSKEQFDTHITKIQPSSGGGDPKAGRPIPQSSTSSPHASANSNPPESMRSGIAPITTFRTSQAPLIKSVNDAKNFLMRSSIYSRERDKNLNSSVTVTPASRVANYMATSRGSGSVSPMAKPIPVPKMPPLQPQYRRRLGRSPSPPPRIIQEQTRATNTLLSSGKVATKDMSKSSMKEVMSRLKSGNYDGSLGAASLGATREAPLPRMTSSVRSDERPLATQGDMLNSIKFERRFREALLSERSGVADKNCSNSRKPSIVNVNSRTSNGNPSNLNMRPSSMNKSSLTATPSPISSSRVVDNSRTRSFFGPSRPMSPKGRRNSPTF